jgi:L,D-peptidoglycan transpeptidase YkuD (ErfK/YbiS/YcfS/YnhG family)
MRRYAREPGGAWRSDGQPVPVVVGRSGVGWGRGLHGDGSPAGRAGRGPVKVEGDGRAPAGVFWIRGAYGYDAGPPAGTRLPYTQLADSWRCVDDPASERYNHVFDSSGIAETWASAEEMRRGDELYRWVVIVGHNDPPARPGGGSCIFLHVWGGPDAPTAGCTAMAEPELSALIPWLVPDETAMVALPEAEYAALERSWGLPSERAHDH